MNEAESVAGFWRWPVVLLGTAALYGLSIWLGFGNLDLKLGDADDALRLVQLREFLSHGEWFNLTIDRLAPPEGYPSHWSRLPDAIMAGLLKLTSLLASPERAEFWMRAIYPGLWLIPACLSVALVMMRLSPHRLALAILFLMIVSNPITGHQFLSGRIDHHGAQIALSVAATAAAALSEGRPWIAVLSGLVTALCLAVGLEALPMLLVPPTALAARFVWAGQGGRELRWYAAALAVGTIAGVLLTVAPERLMETACDALSPNLAAGIIAGALALLALSKVPLFQASRPARLAGVLLAGTVALVALAASDPSCFRGPFAAVDNAARVRWIDGVVEMQPVFSLRDISELATRAHYFAFMIPALPAIVWLISKPRFRNSFAFLTFAGAALIAILFGLMTLRTTSYAIWFIAPVLTLAVIELIGHQHKVLSWTLAVLAFPIVMVVISMWALTPLRPDKTVTENRTTCFESRYFEELAKQPQGLVMAEVNLGPFVLALTHHSVVAAPYHRIDREVLEALDFFSSRDINEARDATSKRGISYVVICPTAAPPGLGDEPDLYLALMKQQPPSWLVPVPRAPDNPLAVYKVIP